MISSDDQLNTLCTALGSS